MLLPIAGSIAMIAVAVLLRLIIRRGKNKEYEAKDISYSERPFNPYELYN